LVRKRLAGSELHTRLLGMQRGWKKLIMVSADMIAIAVALWSGYALRLSEWWPQTYLESAWALFVITPVLGVALFAKLGLYRAVVRFINTQAVKAVVLGVGALALSLYMFAEFLGISQFPRSVPINFALAAILYVGGSRLAVRSYYHWLIKHFVKKEPVLIYGAGGAGVQLAGLLDGGAEYTPVGFLDDDASLWRSSVAGLPVYNPNTLGEVIENQEVTHLLLAIPGVSGRRRREILEYVAEFPLHVKTMPTIPEIISGDDIDSVRDIEIDELLGRDPVPPLKPLIESSLKNKSVLVTGAGGSIGSELARQALLNGASTLVLYELSEFALYSIEQELNSANDMNCKIIPMLGSVLDEKRLADVMRYYSVNTVYHAAAYKHVPLVEHNVLQGVLNNSLGTRSAALAAIQARVERFVLISTDKAVRPTNVMGATKRLAELVLQDLAITENSPTQFSMVRFGNVLGSSGSVVPLFKKQIEQGGPVTVTHPDINRYFMTIPEAASLVVQSGSMASGGDVFVLDMGEPVKIVELAERMIKLSGRTVKRSASSDGDIAIEFSGLRPGEKLYEELLIGDNVSGTEHQKIMRAEEARLESDHLAEILAALSLAIRENDSGKARSLLIEAVSGFNPASNNVDWLSTAASVSVVDHQNKKFH